MKQGRLVKQERLEQRERPVRLVQRVEQDKLGRRERPVRLA